MGGEAERILKGKVGLFLHKKRVNFVWDVLCFTFGLLNIYRVVTTFTAPYFITINFNIGGRRVKCKRTSRVRSRDHTEIVVKIG